MSVSINDPYENPYQLKAGDLAVVGGSADLALHGTVIRINKITKSVVHGELRYHATIVERSSRGRMGDLNGKLRNLTPHAIIHDNEDALKRLKQDTPVKLPY